MRQECPDQTQCLHLVASKGHPLSETGKPTQVLDDKFKRVPLGVRKVGRIAAQADSIAIADMERDSQRKSNREWAARQNIHGVRGFPLLYKGEVLGVSMQFTRIVLESAGEGQVWGRIIADHIGAAIANASGAAVRSILAFILFTPNFYLVIQRKCNVNHPKHSVNTNYFLFKVLCRHIQQFLYICVVFISNKTPSAKFS